jgi:hypothetical protein
MPKSRRRFGYLAEIVECLGPLPIADTITVKKTILIASKAYRHGQPLSPPEDVTILKLAIAGRAAYGIGGQLISTDSGPKARKHPSSLWKDDRFNNFIGMLSGREVRFEELDLRVVEHFVGVGLEAYGLIPSTKKPLGRRPSQWTMESVKNMLAWNRRKLDNGTLTRSAVLTQYAKDAILQRNRANFMRRGLDPALAKLDDSDLNDIANEKHRLEVALQRAPKMTERECRARRDWVACWLRFSRRRSGTRDDFCVSTQGPSAT